MMNRAIFVVLGLLLATSVHADTTDSIVHDAVQKHITQVCLAYNAVPSEGQTKIIKAELDGEPDAEEIVVLFSIEFVDGGNYDVQFISVLKDYPITANGIRPIFMQKIGGKGLRHIESIKVKDGTVFLSGHQCGEGDRPNFPSVPCEFRLGLEGGVLNLERTKGLSNKQVEATR